MPSHSATAARIIEPREGITSSSPRSASPDADAVLAAARRAVARQSFCTLATASVRNRPHVVGVIYAAVSGTLYVHTSTASRKARNVRENPHVALCIPVRRYPLAPPFCVQFQGTAEILAPDDPEIVALVAAGRLKRITAYGALALPDACVLRIVPGRTLSTYGIGVPLLTLLRDPLHANRSVASTGGGER